ncbi:WYL domain-containing protein [Pigmentibacter sp. JX0631]|uniref:helix-turn-helix transcriptional regulator n=1 Tax=Pigmentibacter sp. JX0631 TaxID=2976982 RepID=UPI00246985AE|nr:WYL domain-containing protein [Pigmentibacter sp. JX0631]WGL60027.1 WYL domain-containing protein [Pigmentibacter sp. JX0631]
MSEHSDKKESNTVYVNRILTTFSYISNEISCKDLLLKLEMEGYKLSIKTLQRDLQTLKKNGFINYKKGNWFPLKSLLVVNEIQAVYLLISLIGIQNFFFLKDTQLEQLFSQLAKIANIELHKVKKIFFWSQGIKKFANSNISKFSNTIIQAMNQKKLLQLCYTSYGKSIEKLHIVQPVAIGITEAPYFFGKLINSNSDLEDNLMFRLDRIKQIQILENSNTSYDNNNDFNIHELISKRMGNHFGLDNKTKIKHITMLAINARAVELKNLIENGAYFNLKAILIDPNNYTDKIKNYIEKLKYIVNDNYIIFRFSVAYDSDFIQWILGRMDSIFILDPEDIREEILQKIKVAQERYSKLTPPVESSIR